MSYEVLEKQIKSLPLVYYNELVDYLEYLLEKAKKQSDPSVAEENSLKMIRDAGIASVWESLKNDTW